MTSGYYAGAELLKDEHGKMFHKQQAPVALLLRVLLSSSLPGQTVLDPFAGIGTALVVAKQLQRKGIGIEADPNYFELIRNRVEKIRQVDTIEL